MANWARLQEQLTGLPVVKRARNSIHFDKGNGQVVANFSGKPCHYQDTDGLWKPIDTKLLLLPDGFYGSPHSDVKIHKDGRVKAGGYQQKSALVAAKEGVVDGDKIVREFKFGTQYLYMKEDGFRQETVITRPPTTAEAKYLIASESGELPSKYKRSDITAVDADGAVHEFVNLGQFKKWLDAAAYPVTIDPDFSGSSYIGDNFLYVGLPTRNYGSAPFINLNVGHGLIRFDLSSIPETGTISAAALNVYKDNAASNTRTRKINLYQVSDANGDWIPGITNNKIAAAGEPCAAAKEADGSGGVTTAWAGSVGCATAGTDYDTTKLMETQVWDRADELYTKKTMTFNTAGLAVLESWFGESTNNGILIHCSEQSGGYSLFSTDSSETDYHPS